MAGEDTLNREFLAERDLRIFNARKAGVSHEQVAAQFGISIRAVRAAVSRQLAKLRTEAMLAYPEMVGQELERLDALQAALWSQTQPRRVEFPIGSGEYIVMDPDVKATAQVMAIMAARAKLLGLDAAVNIQVDVVTPKDRLASAPHQDALVVADAESEARQLIELMVQANILPADEANKILELTAPPINDDEVVEGELVDD
jgi:hypothetical protein